eukprot:CAMPEP_0180682652 /NCGR_PEP_ID=MMETSP1037_2-20121125/70677_1 /TAXON_ID=632150 /ORGANISM="Azadinium spinosum, Strain 3D9" /LENGTH=39 /DNA_ID= /DNA_START= /DNA_END= /DNA_ORIENTATION=
MAEEIRLQVRRWHPATKLVAARAAERLRETQVVGLQDNA